MSKLAKSVVGQTFFQLTINKQYMIDKNGYKHTYVDCICSCGKTAKQKKLSKIKAGQIKSCGCRKIEGQLGTKNIHYKHGLSHKRLGAIWYHMMKRCYDTTNKRYVGYGSRGIKVCDEWKDNPISFAIWANNNGYNKNLTLDRIDNNGNYEPNNCRWATSAEQNRNKKNSIKMNITAFGETKSIHNWIDDKRCFLYKAAVLQNRILKGWNPEKAITQPSLRKDGKNLYKFLQQKYPNILAEYNKFKKGEI